MKKFLVGLILVVFLVVPAIAADRMCEPIWSKVAGHSFTIANTDYTIVFSQSWAGPCPQGELEIFQDGVSIGTLTYMSQGSNTIVVGDELTFVLIGNDLLYITPDTLILKGEE